MLRRKQREELEKKQYKWKIQYDKFKYILDIKIITNVLNLAITGIGETNKAMVSAVCCVQGSCVKQENRLKAGR